MHTQSIKIERCSLVNMHKPLVSLATRMRNSILLAPYKPSLCPLSVTTYDPDF